MKEEKDDEIKIKDLKESVFKALAQTLKELGIEQPKPKKKSK